MSSNDEAIAAANASIDMDPLAVRASIEHRFDVNRMVDEYLASYHLVVEHHRTGGRSRSDVHPQ